MLRRAIPCPQTAMDAERLLQELCARHGVDPSRGARLLPLIRWALRGPEEARERILALVERTLSKGGDEVKDPRQFNDAADQAVLISVAKILHNWTPDPRILDLGGKERPSDEQGRESA